MDIVKLLNIAYPLSGIIMTLFYLPQIKLIFKSKSSLKEVSLMTWGIWTVCVFISFLYGLHVLKDLKIALLSLASTGCCGAIFSITAVKRMKYKNDDILPKKAI